VAQPWGEPMAGHQPHGLAQKLWYHIGQNLVFQNVKKNTRILIYIYLIWRYMALLLLRNHHNAFQSLFHENSIRFHSETCRYATSAMGPY
jgi:hypothetical protein